METGDIRTNQVAVERRGDGSVLLRATHALGAYPKRLTERLEHWAAVAPDRVFLAERAGSGWRRVSYAQALAVVERVAQGLLARDVSAERPVLVLSGNDVDHALLGLACMHVGVPYAPISVAYSLLSQDLVKLRQIVALTTPGLVYVADAGVFARALAVLPPEVDVAAGLDALMAPPSEAVALAAGRVDGARVGKLLFTSGSTGSPKAVINTQAMMCANQAMIVGQYRFLAEEPPVLVDWLPWSHTFGGNNNFNMVLYNGGSLYIDEGRPMPGQFAPTVQALREVAPTVHMSVPKGWEELARALAADPALNRHFFSRLRLPFYAAASLPQPLWDELARLSQEATGQVVPMLTGLGATETAPMVLCNGAGSRVAGHVGLPVAGLEVKLAPVDGKLEVRVRGPSITPGYWRDAARTAAAFDEEGFYRMGDAVAWIDPADPQQGLRFDGRLAEDFKLLSGTWVSVGPLRGRVIAAMSPFVRDVVLAGHDRDYLAVLAVLADGYAAEDAAVRVAVAAALARLAAEATGSATRVVRLGFLAGAPSVDAGEMTDKGSLNQRTILARRPAEVAALYAQPPGPAVLCVEEG